MDPISLQQRYGWTYSRAPLCPSSHLTQYVVSLPCTPLRALTQKNQLLNSAGVLLIVEAILLIQPTTTSKQKTLGANIHGILNSTGVALLIAGLIVIEANKFDHGAPRSSPSLPFPISLYPIPSFSRPYLPPSNPPPSSTTLKLTPEF